MIWSEGEIKRIVRDELRSLREEFEKKIVEEIWEGLKCLVTGEKFDAKMFSFGPYSGLRKELIKETGLRFKIENTVKDCVGELIKDKTDETIKSEDFIDAIVDRINRKQLGD